MKGKAKYMLLLGLLAISIIIFGYLLLPKVNTVTVATSELDIVKKETYSPTKHEIETRTIKKLENILLIGIDGDDYDNARSDVMIIATLDSENKDLKLTSVMRDTLTYIPTVDRYEKLNHSYMYSGPAGTVRAMNRNFDLDIENFVTFNYKALSEAVDYVGGFPVNLTAGEAYDMGKAKGSHMLFGEEALKYVRVRKNSGGDTGRNERQRELIIHIMNEAKTMDRAKLVGFVREIIPLVETSYSYADINELLDIYSSIKDDISINQYSFPYNIEGKILQDGLWYAVPSDLSSNVENLHINLYEEEIYNPSVSVERISNYIENYSGVSKWLNNKEEV